MDPEFARHYYEAATQDHWWFRGRAELVAGLTNRAGLKRGRVVDLGAGASSLFPEAFEVVKLDLVRPQGSQGIFVRASVDRLPFATATFNAVGLFDVIEHIDDPATVLREAHRVLQPGGAILYTVPAFQSLWSEHDVRVGHKRRYRTTEIIRLLEVNGFRPVWTAMYYGFLLIPALVRKVTNRTASFAKPGSVINGALTWLAQRSAAAALHTGRRPGLSIGGIALRS